MIDFWHGTNAKESLQIYLVSRLISICLIPGLRWNKLRCSRKRISIDISGISIARTSREKWNNSLNKMLTAVDTTANRLFRFTSACSERINGNYNTYIPRISSNILPVSRSVKKSSWFRYDSRIFMFQSRSNSSKQEGFFSFFNIFDHLRYNIFFIFPSICTYFLTLRKRNWVENGQKNEAGLMLEYRVF